MRIYVFSYSLTGNNKALAAGIAAGLSAEHVNITTVKPVTYGTIAFDMLLNKMPEIDQELPLIEENDIVIFTGPIWMGSAPSPLRRCFKQLKHSIGKYAFVSISGGADGSNPKIEKDLSKRLGKKPGAVIDFHIADLLENIKNPGRDDTSSYRINNEEVEMLSDKAVKMLKETILL